jgi:hypothetical protein
MESVFLRVHRVLLFDSILQVLRSDTDLPSTVNDFGSTSVAKYFAKEYKRFSPDLKIWNVIRFRFHSYILGLASQRKTEWACRTKNVTNF